MGFHPTRNSHPDGAPTRRRGSDAQPINLGGTEPLFPSLLCPSPHIEGQPGSNDKTPHLSAAPRRLQGRTAPMGDRREFPWECCLLASQRSHVHPTARPTSCPTATGPRAEHRPSAYGGTCCYGAELSCRWGWRRSVICFGDAVSSMRGRFSSSPTFPSIAPLSPPPNPKPPPRGAAL